LTAVISMLMVFAGDSSASSTALTEGFVRPHESAECRSLHGPCRGRTTGGGVFLPDPWPVINAWSIGRSDQWSMHGVNWSRACCSIVLCDCVLHESVIVQMCFCALSSSQVVSETQHLWPQHAVSVCVVYVYCCLLSLYVYTVTAFVVVPNCSLLSVVYWFFLRKLMFT